MITQVKPDFMPEALQIAAQCWCDPETSDRVMDIALAKAFANRLNNWMETAAQHARNEDYYRSLVVRCGKAIGRPSFVQDDGGVCDSVLCAKVPELVEALIEGLRRIYNYPVHSEPVGGALDMQGIADLALSGMKKPNSQ